MSSTTNQTATPQAGVDLATETVITGRVVDGSGQAVGGAALPGRAVLGGHALLVVPAQRTVDRCSLGSCLKSTD